MKSQNLKSRIVMRNKIIDKLISALLLSLAATASISTAQAELIDLSNAEPVIEFASRDAGWLRQPNFARFDHTFNCSYDEAIEPCDKELKMVFGLKIDIESRIESVQILRSNGYKKVDAQFIRELSRSRFKPFIKNGQAVAGRVTLPVVFTSQ